MKRLNLAPLLGLTVLVACAHSAVEVARAQDATVINARIVVGDGPVIPNGFISVQRGKIVMVAPGRPSQITGPVIDATGMTALPGFIDGHKHLNTSPLGEKEQMEDLIESGFTTVLSALGPADSNLALIQKIESGQINGPRIIASGRVDLRGTPQQARAAIRAMAAEGIRFTGEMAVTPEPGATPHELAVLRAAVDEGRKDGVEILVHAVSTPAMVAVSEAGVHHEVHLPNKDFMSYDDASRIAGTGTYVLDTVSFGAPIIDVFQQDNEPRFRTGLKWPESVAGANRDEQGRATGTEAAYSMMNARRIWDATHGRGLGYGSDQNYPVRDVLEHELKTLMVMLSVPDVIRVLTINTASFMNMQNEIGTLEPLKRADIVLVAGNPFEDFNDLLKTRVVLKDGKVVVDKRGAEVSRGSQAPATAAAPAYPMVGTLTASVARPEQKPAANCGDLSKPRLAQARVIRVEHMPASSIQMPAPPAGDRRAETVGLPPYCAVTVRLGRARGADSGLALWLPDDAWNGSFLLVSDSHPIATDALSGFLLRGYVVGSLANRAVHEGAEKSKALIMGYYGAMPRYSYWINTMPTADQRPLEEVQRYPGDFDGVTFGGPVRPSTDVGAPAGTTTGVGSPDLSAFATRGGKIIAFGGGPDQKVAEKRVAGYESFAAQSGGIKQTRSFYRLFILPESRDGDDYQADWLTVLDEWVQRARTPEEVLVDHLPPANAQRRPPGALVFEPPFGVRTVCAYPDVAQLQNGSGETPVDWMCLPGPSGAGG